MEPLSVDLAALRSLVASVMWPMFRLAGLFSVMPVLGERFVPVRVRIGLAFLIALLVVPGLARPPDIDPLSIAGMLVTAQQIVIGVAMGLVMQLIFNAVMLAGESIAVTMGLGFALMNDPRYGFQVPTVSQFYVIVTTLLFLALDGHHAVLHTVATSFEALPIGAPIGEALPWQLLRLAGVIWAGALGIALPALAAMLTVNMVMGVMTRSAPQLNIFSVGFPMTMTMGFVALLLTLPGVVETLERMFADMQDQLARLAGG